MTDTNDGPGKIIQILNLGSEAGATLAALTDSGAVFVLGRSGEGNDTTFKWDQVPSPTAADVTIK